MDCVSELRAITGSVSGSPCVKLKLLTQRAQTNSAASEFGGGGGGGSLRTFTAVRDRDHADQ